MATRSSVRLFDDHAVQQKAGKHIPKKELHDYTNITLIYSALFCFGTNILIAVPTKSIIYSVSTKDGYMDISTRVLQNWNRNSWWSSYVTKEKKNEDAHFRVDQEEKDVPSFFSGSNEIMSMKMTIRTERLLLLGSHPSTNAAAGYQYACSSESWPDVWRMAKNSPLFRDNFSSCSTSFSFAVQCICTEVSNLIFKTR